MKKFRFKAYLITIYSLSTGTIFAVPYEGIISVPIADLLGQSMKSLLKQEQLPSDKTSVVTAYAHIPKATSNKNDCPRIYQLLFNERVTVVETQGEEVKIEVPYALYGVGDKGKLAGIYWTLKSNITSLDELSQKVIDQSIPASIKDGGSHIVILQKPYIHQTTGLSLSAGTRLIGHEAKHFTYKVTFLNPASKGLITTHIHKEYFIKNTASKKEAQQAFVKLLKSWAHASYNSPIAYVWGGASFTKNIDGTVSNVETGFDCAGIIIRAAQSCSIPFYLKNSTAQQYHLDPLKDEALQEGDILWIPGHVMVISDLQHNLIIEPRGYASGYGILHEIPLEKLFKDITTTGELISHYKMGVPLKLLNSKGEISSTIPTYKIVRFSSVWQNYHKHLPST